MSEVIDHKGIPKLTKVNYQAWRRAMTMALASERCLDIVENNEDVPEQPLPLEANASAADRREFTKAMSDYRTEWQSYRARAGKAGWLINQTLTPESETYVKDTVDPAEMWEILKDRMDSKGNPVLQRAIRKEFHEIKHDGKESIEEYIRKLRELQRALEGTADHIQDEAIMSKILVTLPPAWDTKISAIEDDETLTLDKLEKILRNFQTKLSSRKTEDVALATRGRGGYRGRGGRGGRGRGGYQGNKVAEGRVTKDAECWYCLEKGHYQASCPLRQKAKERKEAAMGERANAVSKKEDVSKVEEVEMSFMVKHYYEPETEDEWILDSGATGHMCFNPGAFESLKRLPKAKRVFLGDGSEVGAYGTGTIRLNDEMTLEEVLYVPDLTVNLCSVRTLARDNFTVTFKGDKCTIAKHGKTAIIGRGQSLYVLQTEEKAFTANETRQEDATLWHRRLGHLNMASVKKLEEMAKGIAIKEERKEKLCEPCLEGKQHKVYNRHTPATRMTKRLELVHSDTCGPFRVASKAGAKVFVLFIDDFSRMVWCSFLKSKAETTEAFKEFKAITENHSGSKIQRFRCDNGRAEYDNSVFKDILRQNGISYEPSAPYTQNQNGVSERMNRTILEKARSMLMEARLPESFWAEAVNTAVYLHNRSPTRSLEGKTPYEAWNGTKPDLSNLRVFGCDAYLHVSEEKRTKLESKALKCVHLGYVINTTKMWRLWDTAGRRVIRGSNVRFEENSLGGREKPEDTQKEAEKPAPKIIDPLQNAPDFGGSELQAVDDGSKGRFTTGTLETPGTQEKPTFHVEILQRRPQGAGNEQDTRERTQAEMNEIQEPRAPDSDGAQGEESLRRSTRERTQTKMFPGMRAFAARIGKDGEPVTLGEALEAPEKWHEAIADEFRSHKDNGTWKPAKLPPGKKALSTKWVFKIKTNADGSLRYKARLVVRGFEQREGIDYKETFAPVAKFATVRILLALATHFDWEVEQMDVKTAFLYPEIEDEVYISKPEGYNAFHPDEMDTGEVFRLVKTLYGLRQSPLAWFKVLDKFLRSKGLTRSNEDSSLYISKDLIILIFVDDILFFSKDKNKITEAKGWLMGEYKMTDLGDLKQFLGMQIERDRKNRKMFIGQKRYFQKILEQCKMQDCNGCHTPMDPREDLKKPDDKDITGIIEYQSLVGSIMYGMLGTRPDLGYSISTLSKFNSCPAIEHHSAAKRVLRYLQKTKDYGLMFTGKSASEFPEPKCYTDSDWAGDAEDRRSTGGYVFILAGAAVSWKTKKQGITALSSTEAEYVALSEATKEAIWIKRVLRELETREVPKAEVDISRYHEEEILRQWEPENEEYLEKKEEWPNNLTTSKPQMIMADNQGCIKLAENIYGNSKAKHVEIRYHFVRDALQDGKISLSYEPTNTMTADIMTKALPRERHWIHTTAMGVTTRESEVQVGVL